MGYYIRFVFDGDERPDLKALRDALRAADDGYVVTESQALPDDPPDSVFAEITYNGSQIGALELRAVGDPVTDEEIQALVEEVDDLDEDDAVTSTLWNATGLLSVQVLWEGDDHSESLRLLNPLWSALLGRYSGLVQADDEG